MYMGDALSVPLIVSWFSFCFIRGVRSIAKSGFRFSNPD